MPWKCYPLITNDGGAFMYYLVLISMLFWSSFTTGCMDCWFVAQPECIGTHSILVQDRSGSSLQDFNGQITVSNETLTIDVECRTDTYRNTEYYACGAKGLKLRHFDNPVTNTIETLDGRETAEEQFELQIRSAPDTCSCELFETHTMNLE